MKISLLIPVLCIGLCLSASPAASSTIHAEDFDAAGGKYPTNKAGADKDSKNNFSFSGYDQSYPNSKICDPHKDAWSHDQDKDIKADKGNYSFSNYHDEDDRPQFKINDPHNLISYLSDPDHNDKHHDNDRDHDWDDHRKIVNYYREICDHTNDPSYDRHRCDPGDSHATPLPGSLFLFASSILLLSATSLLRRFARPRL